MSTTVTISQNVTSVSVSGDTTTVDVSPRVTTVEVAELSIGQSTSAGSISVTPNDDISSTNVQAAIETLAARNEITSDERSKLEDIEAEADVTDTENVVGALTAGTNISIDSDGTVNANVLGALTAGTNISIGDDGTISASSVSLTDVYTAANESEHLSLDPAPDQGDVVIRSDENKTYIHNGGTAGTMADYTELASNTNGVQSINDATGVVTFGKSNLSDYSANEFIDWTVSQESVSLDIHADNYINTTYTAGTGISISEANVISATGGGGGGTSFTASGNLVLSDSNVLDTVSTPVFDEVRFKDNTGLFNGVLLKAFPNEDQAFDVGEGLGIYFDDPNSNQFSLIGAITETTFQIAGEFNCQTELKVGGGRAILPVSSITTDDKRNSYNVADDFTSGSYLSPFMQVNPDYSGGNTTDQNIANKGYVDNLIDALNVPVLPTVSSNQIADYRYLMAGNNGYIASEFNTIVLMDSPETVNNGIRFLSFDYNTGTTAQTPGGARLVGGTGITIELTSGNTEATISASPDGLPDQSASTDGYVLTSNNSTATWLPITTAAFPTQGSDTIGKFLQSNGLTVQWADVDAYPSQSGNDGKFLTTNGSSVSWAEVDALPTQDANTSGKFLASNGDEAYWHVPNTSIPSQFGESGKFLTTDGTSLDWVDINTAGTTGDITFNTNTISASSSDTVNINDNLNVQGTLDADRLDINGAGTPSIETTGAFHINADDGVYCNSVQVGLESPTFILYIPYTANFLLPGTLTFRGTKFHGATGTPSVTSVVGSDSQREIRINDFGYVVGDDYFVEVTQNNNSLTMYNDPVRIGVHKSETTIKIRLAQGSDDNPPDQAGMIKVAVYEI